MKRFCLILLVFSIVTGANAQAQTSQTEIAVTGAATVTVVPDQATVDAAVVTTAAQSADAVGRNNAIYDRIVAAVTKLGIDRSDIALSSYNIDYTPKPTAPQPGSYDRYGFTVTRSFAIKVRSIAKAGPVVDAATGAGATDVNGVSFGIADDRSAQSEATDRAVADARAKATAVARSAGLHITGIQRIDLGSQGIARPMPMRMSAMAKAPSEPTVLDSGNVNVSANVDVVFLASP